MNTQNILRSTETIIGNTIYKVRAIQSEKARESAEQILIRLIKENIALNITSGFAANFTSIKKHSQSRINTGKMQSV